MSKLSKYTLLLCMLFSSYMYSMEKSSSSENFSIEIENIDPSKLGDFQVLPKELIELICLYSIDLEGDIEKFVKRLNNPHVLRLISRDFKLLSANLLNMLLKNVPLGDPYDSYANRIKKDERMLNYCLPYLLMS